MWPWSSGKLYMVMEFMSHSLRSKAVVNKVDIVRVLADVARALVRLHAAGHIHRDVKAGDTHPPAQSSRTEQR